jgi:hypothetical protein
VICSRCHAEIPPGKLACDCFQVEADNEVEKRALDRLQKGGTLWSWSKAGTLHLLPSVKFCLTLCRQHRVKQPTSVRVFHLSDLRPGDAVCELCLRKFNDQRSIQ